MPLTGRPAKDLGKGLVRAWLRCRAYHEEGGALRRAREPPGRHIYGVHVFRETGVQSVLMDVLPPTLRDRGPARMLSIGSIMTYRALARDGDDPRGASAPCTFHLQELSSVSSWFDLGDVVAKQMWRLSGRKLGSVAELPAALRERIEHHHPAFISNPGI